MCSKHLHFGRQAAWRGRAARIQVCPRQQGITESTIGRRVCPGHVLCTSFPSLPGEVLQDTLDGSLPLGADFDTALVHLDSRFGGLLGLAAGPLPLLGIRRLLLDPILTDTLIVATQDPLECFQPVCPVCVGSLEELGFIAAGLAAWLWLKDNMCFIIIQSSHRVTGEQDHTHPLKDCEGLDHGPSGVLSVARRDQLLLVCLVGGRVPACSMCQEDMDIRYSKLNMTPHFRLATGRQRKKKSTELLGSRAVVTRHSLLDHLPKQVPPYSARQLSCRDWVSGTTSSNMNMANYVGANFIWRPWGIPSQTLGH